MAGSNARLTTNMKRGVISSYISRDNEYVRTQEIAAVAEFHVADATNYLTEETAVTWVFCLLKHCGQHSVSATIKLHKFRYSMQGFLIKGFISHQM